MERRWCSVALVLTRTLFKSYAVIDSALSDVAFAAKTARAFHWISGFDITSVTNTPSDLNGICWVEYTVLGPTKSYSPSSNTQSFPKYY